MEQFGRYQLTTRIAIGGMAEIFRAKQQGEAGFSKEVVVKRVLPHYSEDDSFVTMFIDEAVLAAKLNHPNIVTIFDFGAINNQYYIAMEYVEGVDLRKIMREAHFKQKPIGQNRSVQIALGMVRGLGHAHERSDGGKPLFIVHRDVSPHNVLISLNGDIKVMDFGIAKAAARATHTATGIIKGKLAYMAPEQARGEEIDARADIFATGICLWEMLANKRLFVGDSDIETLEKVKNAPIPDLTTIVKDMNKELNRIVHKMLERDKSKRYQKMREVDRDLSAVLYQLGGPNAEDAALDEYLRSILPKELVYFLQGEARQTTHTPLPAMLLAGVAAAPKSTLPANPREPASIVTGSKPTGSDAIKTAALSEEDLRAQDLLLIEEVDNEQPKKEVVQEATILEPYAQATVMLPAAEAGKLPDMLDLNVKPQQHTGSSTQILYESRTRIWKVLALFALLLGVLAGLFLGMWPRIRISDKQTRSDTADKTAPQVSDSSLISSATLPTTTAENVIAGVRAPAVAIPPLVKSKEVDSIRPANNADKRNLDKKTELKTPSDTAVVVDPKIEDKNQKELRNAVVSFLNCPPGTQVFENNKRLPMVSAANQHRYLMPAGMHNLKLVGVVSDKEGKTTTKVLVETLVWLRPHQTELVECP